MAPARPRPAHDDVSETSSLGLVHTSGVSKGKKPHGLNTMQNGASLAKTVVNGHAANMSAAAAGADVDPNLPKIPWQDLPLSTLHAYRHAHRLGTPSAYSSPHADLYLRSSRVGLRSPTLVIERLRAREQQRLARAAADEKSNESNSTAGAASGAERRSSRIVMNGNGNGNGTNYTNTHNPDGEGGGGLGGGSSNPTAAFGLTGDVGAVKIKQTKEQLAMAVRRHFNAMSVSEAEVIARFAYVTRHDAAQRSSADAGAGGGGGGGSGGGGGGGSSSSGGGGGSTREPGGDSMGFRLRFRP